MTRVLGALKLVRPWQWLALLVLFAGAAGATYGIYQWVAASDDGPLAQDQQLIPVQRDDLVTSISINGSLVFPDSETASFDTQGTLGELSVAVGDAVTAGQTLARLDDDTVVALEEARAKALFDLSTAQDALSDAMTPHTQLDIEKAEAKVSNAREAVRVAEDKLFDLLEVTDHQIAVADSAVADANLKISDIEDDIDSLTIPDQRKLADLEFRIDTAQTALDNAQRDHQLVAEEWAKKVDDAREVLQDAADEYALVFEKWLGVHPDDVDPSQNPHSLLALWNADLNVLFDQSAVDDRLIDPPPADDPATVWDESTVYAFTHLSPYNTLVECEDPPSDPNTFCIADEMSDAWDKVADARSALEDLETPAATALAKANDAVAKAEEALSDAKHNLTDLLEPPGTFALLSKQKELAAARTALAEAETDLADLQQKLAWRKLLNIESAEPGSGKGINPNLLTNDPPQDISDDLRTALLAGQMDVDDALLALRDAQDSLETLNGSSDPALIALRQAEIATAQIAVETASDRLQGVALTAPLTGVVSDVALEAGDAVNPNTAVLTIVDPAVIEMQGSVDEIDVLYLQMGALANVTMDALPGQSLFGTVSHIASDAVNQQGIVTYDVSIRVDAPSGIELRSGLTAIAELVLRSEPDVLLIPLQALRGSFTQPTVLVSHNGVLTERPVTTGSSDDFWVVVENGLTEGELIVMEGIGESSQFGFGGFRGIPGGFVPLGGGRGGPR